MGKRLTGQITAGKSFDRHRKEARHTAQNVKGHPAFPGQAADGASILADARNAVSPPVDRSSVTQPRAGVVERGTDAAAGVMIVERRVACRQARADEETRWREVEVPACLPGPLAAYGLHFRAGDRREGWLGLNFVSSCFFCFSSCWGRGYGPRHLQDNHQQLPSCECHQGMTRRYTQCQQTRSRLAKAARAWAL